MLTLCMLYYFNENDVQFDIQRIISQDEGKLEQLLKHSDNRKSTQLETKYAEILVRKNLEMAFREEPMDFLNYFRQIEINEQSVYDDRDIKLLTNLSEL
jgi:hypothetical protein